MRKPTPTPSITTATTHNPPPGGRVPLAVWATTNTEQTPGLSTPNWLTQLLTEYARPDGRTVMLTDTGDRHPPYPPARQPADSPPPPDLVVVLAHLRRPPDDDIRPGVLAALRELPPGGLLAVVTRSRPTSRRPHTDLVTASVRAAADAGFGYFQHLIVIDDPNVSAAAATPPPTTTAAPAPAPVLHRTAHLDIAIFQLPTEPVRPAAPNVSGR